MFLTCRNLTESDGFRRGFLLFGNVFEYRFCCYSNVINPSGLVPTWEFIISNGTFLSWMCHRYNIECVWVLTIYSDLYRTFWGQKVKEKGHFVQFQSIRIKSLKPKCVRLHRQINYNSNVPNKPQMTWTSNCECNLRKFMTNEKIICHAELVSASYQWSVLTSSL